MNLCDLVDTVHWPCLVLGSTTTLQCPFLHQGARLGDIWNVVVTAKLRNRSNRSKEVAFVGDVRNVVVVAAHALPSRHRPNRSKVALINYVRNVVPAVSVSATAVASPRAGIHPRDRRIVSINWGGGGGG